MYIVHVLLTLVELLTITFFYFVIICHAVHVYRYDFHYLVFLISFYLEISDLDF